MTEGLLNCPFCGGEAYIGVHGSSVGCYDCGAEQHGGQDGIPSPVAAWNQRQPDPALAAMREVSVLATIDRLMIARKVSQRDLGKRIGVSEARVSQMLTVGSNMTIGTIERIFTALAAPHDA